MEEGTDAECKRKPLLLFRPALEVCLTYWVPLRCSCSYLRNQILCLACIVRAAFVSHSASSLYIRFIKPASVGACLWGPTGGLPDGDAQRRRLWHACWGANMCATPGARYSVSSSLLYFPFTLILFISVLCYFSLLTTYFVSAFI